MKNNTLEAQVWQITEENKELKERINQLEKIIEEIKKSDKSEFKEILYKIQDFNVKISESTKSIDSILEWKTWIDKIIEKIKKILPI